MNDMGPLQRLIGVFTSPSKTFASIAEKPGWDWLLPVFLLMGAFFVQQTVLVQKMDVDEAVKLQMKFVDKMAGGKMSEADRAKVEEQTRQGIEASKTPVRRGLTMLFVFVPVLLVPLIYHGIAAAFATKTRYVKVLCGYAYTQIIYVVPLLLSAVVAIPQASIDVNDIQYGRVLKSNPAAFLDFDTTHKALLGLLSSVDPFDIWGFVVGSIALSKTTLFKPASARFVVGGVWGAYILLKIILGTAYSSFMG